MQINYRFFPHPVLSPFSDDLIDSAFQCSIKPNEEGFEYKFEVTARVSDDHIAQLIEAGDAVFGVHLECPATRYRNLYKYFDDSFVIRIPKDFLEGRVQVCAFILAAKDISKYVNPGFHPDYDGISFLINRGDILAVDENRIFIIEREDTLQQLPSIFTITRNFDPDPPAIDLDLMGHKIVIKLSPANFEKYSQLQQDANLHPLMNALIVLPGLIHVLDIIDPEKCSLEELSEREDQRWYRVLRRTLEKRGVRLESGQNYPETAISLASRLIGNPLSNGLESVMGFAENED